MPRTELPESVSGDVSLLPSAGLGDGLRTALVDGAMNPTALLVVLGWAAATTLLTARFFRFGD